MTRLRAAEKDGSKKICEEISKRRGMEEEEEEEEEEAPEEEEEAAERQASESGVEPKFSQRCSRLKESSNPTFT